MVESNVTRVDQEMGGLMLRTPYIHLRPRTQNDHGWRGVIREIAIGGLCTSQCTSGCITPILTIETLEAEGKRRGVQSTQVY